MKEKYKLNQNNLNMGTPTLKLLFDRRHRATATKEGAIELRITYNRVQKHATTGVRVLPKHWRNGRIVNRIDAMELQRTLDMFVANAHKTINDLIERGELDMNTIVSVISGRQKAAATSSVDRQLLLDYFNERAAIRKYGRSTDSQERYDRFLRWFEKWGVMVTFSDINEANIMRLDEALGKMKPYSKWNNYHRFLNSFILDAIADGLMRKNPYKTLHINKDKTGDGLSKYLTKEEFMRLEHLKPNTPFLEHARDLFVFQTYTCLSYTDMASFDPGKMREVNGRMMYTGKRGKTKQEYVFVVLRPALDILEKYNGRLPMMSNQKYNDYLKLLAISAKIQKPVSSHWARHTGATLLLNSGCGMEVVSKVLGHSSTKITRSVYAKLLDETVAEAMGKMELMLRK